MPIRHTFRWVVWDHVHVCSLKVHLRQKNLSLVNNYHLQKQEPQTRVELLCRLVHILDPWWICAWCVTKPYVDTKTNEEGTYTYVVVSSQPSRNYSCSARMRRRALGEPEQERHAIETGFVSVGVRPEYSSTIGVRLRALPEWCHHTDSEATRSRFPEDATCSTGTKPCFKVTLASNHSRTSDFTNNDHIMTFNDWFVD